MPNNYDYKPLLKTAIKYGQQYLENLTNKNVFPDSEELKNLAQFDEALPQQPSDPIATLEFLNKFGSPATTAINGSRYFGFVNGAVLPAALGARILTDTWNQSTVSEVASPIGAKIEEVVQGWVVDLFGLSDDYIASFVSGTTAGHVVSLSAARNKIYQNHNFDIKKRGLFAAPKIRIIVSAEAHVTLFKAISIIGLGTDNIEIVPTDHQGRMVADKIPQLDAFSIICAQAGNLNSGDFDPLEEIGKRAQATGALMQVDGAFGLWAAACDNKKHLTKGLEYADFMITDGHKTLNSSYDSAIVLSKITHLDALKSVMSCQASYLAQDTKIQSKDITLDFSKRTRAIDFWAAIRSLGKSGISNMVQELCDNAEYFAAGLKKIGYEILNEVVFNQVVARIGSDEQLDEIVKNIQNSGICWFGKTTWKNRNAFRISVSSFKTQKSDIDQCLEVIARITDNATSSSLA